MPYKSEEDYLKAIYKLGDKQKHPYISNKMLMHHFNHTIQSISEMIKKLDAKGYVDYVPYKGSTLTALGRQHALDTIAKHRIWELFLIEHLGYDWRDVHREAEKLEHATSKVLLEKMRQFLNYPKTCPHGNPIPSDKFDDIHRQTTRQSLYQASVGDEHRLISVVDDLDTLNYLSDYHVKLGDSLTIVQRDDLNQVMLVKPSQNTTMIIGYHIAKKLFIN